MRKERRTYLDAKSLLKVEFEYEVEFKYELNISNEAVRLYSHPTFVVELPLHYKVNNH